MIPIEIRFVVVILACLTGAGLSIAYVFTDQRRKAKKPVYAAKAVILLFAALIYTFGLVDPKIYLIRSGWATQLILFMFVCALTANIVTDWRKR
jgi:hypothetical protein